ncbi:ribosomal protein S18-alanine N-acetyltransferase [Longispora albida]|uniref:ribosomal protein S18-alanine N-acetyltransferase n=1 Tax=Longispora albida TaxID=203523 RepID=UPI0003807DDD|nr:ribosomal protein S18-alanine N-acetyltransferase [Longispora albida]
MILELLGSEHLPALLVIERDLFGSEAWTRWMIQSELDAGHYYRAATEDGELVGYAGLAVVDDEEAWVQNIAVRRDQQGKGIGAVLLEDLLREAGNRTVGLEVATDNPAQRLYLRYGFEIVGVRKRYYQPSNKDALVMLRPSPVPTPPPVRFP